MAQKVSSFLQLMVPKVPLLITTSIKHYTVGPPKPSWSYKFNITVALLQSFVAQLNSIPVRQSQTMSRMTDENAPVVEGAVAAEDHVPNSYRDQAAAHLDRIFAQEGINTAKLGWDWKHDPRATEPLLAEWTEMVDKEDNYNEGRTVLFLHGGGYFLGSIKTHRWASGAMARLGAAKVFCM